MKTSLSLIGFMGAGKSAVGRALAYRLGKRFVEADAEIECKAGKSISQIFLEDGEIGFRDLEIEVIKDISREKGQIIACGGGVVLNQINISRLKLDSVIIWLIATPSMIVKRTGLKADVRPMLEGMTSTKDIRGMLRSRKPFYELAADMTVDTSKLEIEAVVAQILDRLKQNADFN